MTLSVAISKSYLSTDSLFFLLAWIAASLHKLAISAPENPGVSVANLLAYSSIVYYGFNFIFYKCKLNIYFLPSISGNATSIILSNLPGLVNALSNNYA